MRVDVLRVTLNASPLLPFHPTPRLPLRLRFDLFPGLIHKYSYGALSHSNPVNEKVTVKTADIDGVADSTLPKSSFILQVVQGWVPCMEG